MEDVKNSIKVLEELFNILNDAREKYRDVRLSKANIWDPDIANSLKNIQHQIFLDLKDLKK